MWIWLLVAFLLGGFALWWNRQQDGMVRRDAVDNARKSVEQAERTARNTTRKLKVDIGGSDTAANSLFDSANSATTASTEAQPVVVNTPVETAPQPAPEITAPSNPDDLTRIDGIGPKFQEVLYTAGIKTFAQLATQTEAQLLDLLKAAGMRKPANIGTWATQATFAAKGDWNGLSDYLAENEDDE